MSLHLGKRWSWGIHDATKEGTKQFGALLWGVPSRTGFQLNFWRWEFQLMRERKP